VRIIRSTAEFIDWRLKHSDDVGFVPTMGNLHAGHMSLLETSLKEHSTSVLSIFVNPTQFGPNDDFDRYPRTLEADALLAESLLKKHPGRELVVFAPANPQEIYPEGFGSAISVPSLDGFLEGALRPGHFTGVATVVYLLFSLVKPRTAYFGRKDYQQYRVIKRMVRDLALPIRIKGMPIIRDEHGLALSSRNQYLSSEERENALYLIRTLKEAERRLGKETKNAETVKSWMNEQKNKDSRWQYLELREARSLSEKIPARGKLVMLAVLKVGTVRLLDNLEIETT
jgi:pantoate--beta-alanine ligase